MEHSFLIYPNLLKYIKEVIVASDQIDEVRKDKLKEIASFILHKKQASQTANLTFICTHNSRRSHLCQIWAATAAAYYGVEDDIQTFSGGTEVTAFNHRAVAAIKRCGFYVENSTGENPHYKVHYSEVKKALECFSKKYDDDFNANENFLAIMTCSEADKDCPFIPGASMRVSTPYFDPKESDDTDQETIVYDARCRQIATEMFYLMSQIQ